MTRLPTDAATERQRLAAIVRYGVVDASPDDAVRVALTGLCELAVDISGAPHAVVNIIDDRFQHQVAAYGCDPAVCGRDESMCATTLAGGTDLAVPDASADVRFVDSPFVDGRLASIRMYCGTILWSPAGFPLGTLCVFDDRERELRPDQVRGLRLLADQVVDQLELALRTADLERSHEALTRSQERLAAFAGQIGHDLKAPITAILGFGELLTELDAVAEDPVATGYVARCVSSAGRMRAMIDDLLAFARVGGSLTPSVVELDELLPEVLDDLGAALGTATVDWAGPPLVGDRQQIRALLQNLVANAVVHARPGVAPAVRVTTEAVDGAVVLRVADNGRGIPADRREEVVKPLVRLDASVPGAGLGLSVCARIVAAHGGTLAVEDGPAGDGTGTTMVITLPQA